MARKQDDTAETPIDTDEQFTNPSGVTKRINGKETVFYSLSIKAAKQLRSLAKPLGRAFSVLFGGIGQEVGGRKLDKTVTTTSAAGEHQVLVDKSEEVEAIETPLAQLKIDTRSGAVEEAISTLLEDKNVLVVILLCMDSQRDEFPRTANDREKMAKAQEIEAKADLSTLTQWVLGMAAANTADVGPLLARLGGADAGSDESRSPQKTPGT